MEIAPTTERQQLIAVKLILAKIYRANVTQKSIRIDFTKTATSLNYREDQISDFLEIAFQVAPDKNSWRNIDLEKHGEIALAIIRKKIRSCPNIEAVNKSILENSLLINIIPDELEAFVEEALSSQKELS